MKAIRQLEYDYQAIKGEINNEESETIQNQSYSVNEILLKFTQGQPLDIMQPHYFDDIGDDDFDAVDPTLRPDFDLSDTDGIDDHIKDLRSLNELKSDESTQQISDKEIKQQNTDDETKDV